MQRVGYINVREAQAPEKPASLALASSLSLYTPLKMLMRLMGVINGMDECYFREATSVIPFLADTSRNRVQVIGMSSLRTLSVNCTRIHVSFPVGQVLSALSSYPSPSVLQLFKGLECGPGPVPFIFNDLRRLALEIQIQGANYLRYRLLVVRVFGADLQRIARLRPLTVHETKLTVTGIIRAHEIQCSCSL